MVSLIGAGPGDPELITLKGLKRLRTADVVLYDRLSNDILLNECKQDCIKLFVGKEAGLHHVKQEDTIQMLIEYAGQGLNVVRLKGGDPMIFGRGSEEAIELKQAGIEFEIIPGITAALGATAYAGIPVTHRNLVTKCLLVTAHEDPNKSDSQVNWKEIAQLTNSTIVVYMGVGNMPSAAAKLIEYGMEANTPVAIIENGTHNSQRTLTTRLIDTGKCISENKIKPPAIFVISPTVNLKNEIEWFENKPLFGRRIVVTRAADQVQSLSSKLTELGADVLHFNVIRTEQIMPPISFDSLKSKGYDWIVFTSENGVRYFFNWLKSLNFDSRALAEMKAAVIGSGTAERLSNYNITADFMPAKYTSEAMLEEMPNQFKIDGTKFLRIKGDFEQDFLTDGLLKIGGKVDTVDVYRIIRDKPSVELTDDLINYGCDAVTFTSKSTVVNFFETLGIERANTILHSAIAIAIGPVTAEALISYGIENIVKSDVHTINGVIDTLKKTFQK